jgi:hypothetical protein
MKRSGSHRALVGPSRAGVKVVCVATDPQ